MSSKKINIIANVVLPTVVIVMTITLFLIFKPHETTSLFYINLFYTVFLEAIFFGYINVLHTKTKELSASFFATIGVYSLYYIIAGFGWLLLYSFLLLYYVPLKVYLTGIMIFTLLWIIITILTALLDNNNKQTTDKLKEQGLSLNFYAQKIALLASRYAKLCEEKGLKYETDSNNRTTLDRLMGKISFLAPNIFRNETTAVQISSILSKCEDIINETESATEEELKEIQKKMQSFVNNSVAEIDMLKNLTKG